LIKAALRHPLPKIRMVDRPSRPIRPGDTVQLAASYRGHELSNSEITWSSGDKSIATVDSSGIVTFIRSGLPDLARVKIHCKTSADSDGELLIPVYPVKGD
jgi:uncharacterized protein YjdB